MPDELGAPSNPSEIYRARGDEVPSGRPLLQGDVFRDVEIPGVDEGAGLGLILQHACSMREGANLRDKLLVARIEEGPRVPPTMWKRGHFRYMPLPELIPGIETWYRVDFDLLGLVPSAILVGSERIACLDDFGIALLQQRLAHHMTRVIIDTGAFMEVLAPVLAEAELLEEWVAQSGSSSEQAELEFHEFIRRPLDDLEGRTLQNDLKETARRSAVRRAVMRELRDRHGPSPSSVREGDGTSSSET